MGREILKGLTVPKPRPYLLRFFLRWLKASRSKFMVPAPQVTRCIDSRIYFIFPCLPRNLSGHFNRDGITIAANNDGECWDYLGDFDTVEARSVQGYYCELCQPETRKYYQNHEQFWVEHTFEPFLKWCNENLAQSNWLAFYEFDDLTAAKLLRDETEDNYKPRVKRVLVPLRQNLN